LTKDLKTVGKPQEEKTENEKITIDSNADKFVSKFLGLSNYLQNKLIQFKKRAENGNNIYEKKGGFITNIANFIHFVIIIMFVVNTFQSLTLKSPPNLSFFMNDAFKKKFKPDNLKNEYLYRHSIISDLVDRVNDLFYGGDLLDNVMMISQMRFSFVIN
jgi:hypothetical protein